jgi:hypothetical protein
MYETDASKQGPSTGQSSTAEASPRGGQGERSAQPQMKNQFYVNSQPVRGLRESRPTVRQILQAAGQDTQDVVVYRLKEQNDAEGQKIELDAVIESPNEVCYLRVEGRGEESDRAIGLSDIKGASGSGGGQRTGGGGGPSTPNRGGSGPSPPGRSGQPTQSSGQPSTTGANLGPATSTQPKSQPAQGGPQAPSQTRPAQGGGFDGPSAAPSQAPSSRPQSPPPTPPANQESSSEAEKAGQKSSKEEGQDENS